jgi:hypothetical protein
MSDVILAISIFHSLCALTLIAGSALSALRRHPRSTVQLPSAAAARSAGAAPDPLGLADATAHAA